MFSLADLRARNIRPSWQEAIAVVQELIQTVAMTTGSPEQLPNVEDVALIPNGDVVAIPGSRPALHPVRHAAVMLQLLLDGVPAPPELVQFIERNIAEPPQYDTVAEFSRNLAFFERPGRRADVERLVGRAIEADQHSRADEELRRLKEKAAAAAPTPERVDPMTPATQPNTQTIVVGALAAACMLVATAVWWFGTGGSEPEVAPQALTANVQPADIAGTSAGTSTSAPEAAVPPGTNGGGAVTLPGEAVPANLTADGRAGDASDQVSQAVNTIPPSLVEKPGLLSRIRQFFFGGAHVGASAYEPVMVQGKDILLEESVDPAAPSMRAGRPAPRRPRVEPGPAPAAAVPDVAEAVAPIPVPAPSEAPAPTAMPTPRPMTAEEAVLEAAATPGRALVVPTLVYSAADDGVVPPTLVRPVLPDNPPANVPEEMIGTLELIVNEDGTVAQARLTRPIARYQERMIVSNAKTWLFRPAMKDGKPVKYRTYVRLTI